MGTSALTVIYDDYGAEIVRLYRQHDGGTKEHGEELVDFLSAFAPMFSAADSIRRRYIGGNDARTANGMNCLVAQMISHFKGHVPCEFYLYAANSDVLVDYVYHVYSLRCWETLQHRPKQRRTVGPCVLVVT